MSTTVQATPAGRDALLVAATRAVNRSRHLVVLAEETVARAKATRRGRAEG